MGITHAFAADITKAERDANGDLIVYGKATGPDVDLDQQVCDPAWLKSAMPAWAEWGNLREMHQPIAAGVGMELQQQGDDWFVKSKVVDDGTARKIEAGALKGYSVGIRNATVVKDATAPGGRIVGGTIVEVSYVDRPCNPTATLAIAKAAGADAVLAPVEAPEEEPSDRDKAVALVEKAVGPDGQIDETADIEGGRQAIALIAGLIKTEADELAAGALDESYDIALLVRAVECLKCWLAKEQAADTGVEADEGIAYVALAAKFGYTPEEVDALPAEMKAALAELAKRDFSTKEREQAADEGQAMPDGSFPIKNKGDLSNAIQAIGRAKDPAAARAHIKRRARALGAEDMIPDSWKDIEPDVTKSTEPDLSAFVSKDDLAQVVKGAVTEATKAAQERVEALAAELAKVKATPIPGGPAITTTATRKAATTPDLQRAAHYEQMANQVQGDPTAAAGYRQKAADLRRAHVGQSQ